MSNRAEQSQTKQQWLAQRLTHYHKTKNSVGLQPQPRPSQLPLSFAQQRLWFLEQWEPGSTAYLLPFAWRLQGNLDMPSLNASFSELVERHESLRTIFAVDHGQPVQVIAPAIPISLPVHDLTALPAAEQDQELQRRIEQEAQQAFILTTGPLWRGHLLRLGPEHHVLLLTFHHIVTDGWSMGLFIQELNALYAAHVAGQSAAWPPLRLQYADFAIWQREWLQGERLDRQLTYWRARLSEAPPMLNLPTDFPRPPQQTYRGGRYSFTLPSTLARALQTLSQQEGMTLFMTLLAGFQTLLARYAGQRDILVGTPIAGRTHTELEPLIGFFVNTLVIRTHVKPYSTFRDLLHQVRDTCLEAYAHQDLPFEKLVEVLQPVRDTSRHPFFQVMFQLHHAKHTDSLSLPHLKVEALQGHIRAAKFDVLLSMIAKDDHLEGTLTFNTDLFGIDTISRMAAHFRVLLEALVTEPRTPLSRLSLLTGKERQQLLGEWNRTAAEFPRHTTISQLFERQAEKTPEAVAVVCDDCQVTYRVLNGRANRLAHYLRRQGVGPEVRVGICMKRHVDMVMAVLAVLKAGGAYVPLDPQYPNERLTYMLADAHAPIVLTDHGLDSLLQDFTGTTIRCEWAAIQHESSDNLPCATVPANLAYVLYTSGSTGTPKGVMIQQDSVVAFLHWAQRVFNAEDIQGVLAGTSLCFDLSVFELFVPLCWGGTLVLAENALECATLKALDRVTLINTVPSAVEVLLEKIVPRAVKIVNLAGEPLSPSLVEAVYSRWPVEKVHDLYGPSETTTYATCAQRRAGGPATIGQPLANIQIYLRDPAGQLVPPGVPGELYIGGCQVSRGYLNRPGLTAENFVPDPLSGEPGRRLYRTGDHGRQDCDGSYVFRGRTDSQIKIRGYRVELGEIEAVLNRHPAIHQAVVMFRKGTTGMQQVVAYVELTHTSHVNTLTLRQYLQTRLPEYMLPAAFVILKELPLTTNGKINRQALPIPDHTHFSRTACYVPPRTPFEELLVEIWQDLLHVKPIGIHDNFFELGGHSLLATQVVARTQSCLKTEVSLRVFFERPTIAELCETIQALRPQSSSLPLQVRNPDHDLPLSFAQQRLWFLEQWEQSGITYLLPYAWRLQGPLQIDALTQSLKDLTARHESLRTHVATRAGVPYQVINGSAAMALTLHDLTARAAQARETELQRLMHQETQQSFNLETGPLWRMHLLRFHAEEHVLLFTLHHLITDGWSMRILFREISTLYAAHVTGQPADLPPLPLQYADFTVWQREWLQGDRIARQISYWRTKLSGAAPYLALQTDKPRPPQQTYRGNRMTLTFPPSLTHKLTNISRQEGCTLFMTLLAAFQVLLFRESGQSDILVGTPIAGRTHTELEGLVGFFVNTLVIRTQCRGQSSFLDILQQVRENCLEAYTYQDLPFEKLVEALQPVRDPSRHPVFQIMFQFDQPEATTPLTLHEMKVVPLGTVSDTAKFDLSLNVMMKEETLLCAMTYKTDLFEPATISRFLSHYQTLLEGVAADPAQAIYRLPLLNERERQQLLEEWNSPVSCTAPSIGIHHLIESQAALNPEAVAVVVRDHHMTYRELNRRADRLASVLQTQGVGPDARVGICMERGLPLITCLLSTLKAGGAYVPVDPSTPQERLRFMIEDADVSLVLTTRDLQTRITASFEHAGDLNVPGPPVHTFEDLSDLSARNTLNAAVPSYVHAENLAYVMYTSGSTGKPKGVEIPHRAVVRLIRQQTYLTWPTRIVCLQLAPPAFDASTFEIWACLAHGGTLILAPTHLPSFDELGSLLHRHQITILWLTAGLFHQMVDWDLQALRPVQVLLAGGDVLSPRHITHLTKQLPACQLINGYGPTENTTFTCCHPLLPSEQFGDSVPIGRPITHTQVYVLDAHENLMSPGMPGEICISGLGLARGYHRQPELTAEKFLPHPFSPVSGARLYRSGDIGRWKQDGVLEFLGRQDHQVKIRGYRIECGDIETNLAMHPAIREVLVLPRETREGQKNLVAYFIPASDTAPDTTELRTFLNRKLPSYMIPGRFVALPAFPLTDNGKIDRHKLPSEDGTTLQPDTHYVAPRNTLESQLATVWEKVLNKHPVGVTDNFFSMGGESLLAIRLCSEMERALGKKVPVSLIFQTQTIEQLSAIISTGNTHTPSSFMGAIQSSGTNPPLFCVLFGSSFRRHLPEFPQQPVYMFYNQGYDGNQALHTTVEAIAACYVKDVRAVQPTGPYYLAGYSFGGMVVYEMAQQLLRQGETVGLLALVDPTTPCLRPSPPPYPAEAHPANATGGSPAHKQWNIYLRDQQLSVLLNTALGAIHWRWKSLQSWYGSRVKKLLCRIFFTLHRPLPFFLRLFYRTVISEQAAKRYVPQHYPGPIVIYQTKDSVETYWSRRCKEVLQVHNLPCKHGDIYLDRPHTLMLLESLISHLEMNEHHRLHNQ